MECLLLRKCADKACDASHGTDAERLFAAPLTPLCAPELAARLRLPQDLAAHTLLRSYRADEWQQWFAAVGTACPPLRGFVFDSSLSMAEAVMQQAGVALLPANMFTRDIRAGRLAQPFELSIDTGAYWLTRLKSKPAGRAMLAFRAWLLSHAEITAIMPSA